MRIQKFRVCTDKDLRFEISVLVERICECRLEQLATVRRNIERWREKGCLESSVLDECEYHVQKFEEAGKEADEEEEEGRGRVVGDGED